MIAEIILFTLFLVFLLIGFYIIYKQVALVKKGEFRIKDQLQCLFYGFIFSLAVILVIAMAFIFAVETPEFWKDSGIIPEKINPTFLNLPLILSLAYLSVYPLIDFLFIALSPEKDEGLTPFHKFLGHYFINLSKSKLISVFMALCLYSIFIVPPILFSLAGVPFLLIWISWMLVYPLMILVFYGSKGYIAGITNEYYHIPNIRSSLFLGFEDSKRNFNQFIKNPRPFIALGLMVFVFVWAWISMFQTVNFFFSGSLAISTMTSYFVFITLLFGVIGYFTRFWGRKIKYRGIDIYFAAYLMATIGINVLVNFLIVNADKLKDTFNSWTLTYNITSHYILFAWPAVIEEVFLIIFTTYYFLSKTNDFTKNLKYSKITEYGQTFDPIPLFNLILNKDIDISNHAKNTLRLMYERIPKKANISLNNWKYRNLLIDGLSSSNSNLKKISYEILNNLFENSPEIIFPWLENALKSPNYDKVIPVLKLIKEIDTSFIRKINSDAIVNLLKDPEWRVRLLGLNLSSFLIDNDGKLISTLNIIDLLDDPNTEVQVEVLNLLSKSSLRLSPEIFTKNLNSVNKALRAATIRNIKNVNLEKLDSKFIEKIIPLMKAPGSLVRASLFEALSKIGRFKKYSIPIEPILESLTDLDTSVRTAASKALETCFNETPNLINLNDILARLDPNNPEINLTVIKLLAKLWKKDPEKILTTFMIYLKLDNLKVKDAISSILIDKYASNSEIVFDYLIRVKDDVKFVSKGIVSKTLISIAKQFPDEIIPKLINSLNSNTDEVILNALVSLDGLIEKYPQKIDLNPIISILNKPVDITLKKQTSQLIAKSSKLSPEQVKPNIPLLINSFPHLEVSVLNILLRSILEIVKNDPNIISAKTISGLLDQKDPLILETVIKILGYVGKEESNLTTNLLIDKALNHEDWIIRNAAVLSLGNVIRTAPNKESIIERLIPLLDDENNWVQKSIMNLFSTLGDKFPSQIPLERIYAAINNQDSKIREGAAQLLEMYLNTDLEKAFDYYLILLGDESKEVRAITIDIVVKIFQKIGISKVISKLLKNLSDEVSIETQQSIAIILTRTLRYGDESIKKRAIALLKIRCEVSQDPIICENLTKLRES